jgi:uncharacterized protein (TIGR02145 family)
MVSRVLKNRSNDFGNYYLYLLVKKIANMKTRQFFALILAALSTVASYSQAIQVNLKAFLEGPFNGAMMGTLLNSDNYLPLAQPYNTAPWNYQGTESVAAIPNADVVDWVLVELRETAGDASTAYEGDSIASQAGFILKDGTIVSVDGTSPMQLGSTVTYKLYAVVFHRNHLPVLSGGQLILNAGTYAWDFTTSAAQAYGGSNAHKELTPGIWGMVAGDGDANGQVNNADKNDVWKPQSGLSGYRTGDFSMNGQVDNVDKNDLWKVNSGKSAQMPGPWVCEKPFADTRDGQVYSTVQIGTQCWMAKNMNVGTMIMGVNNQTNNGIIEKHCYENSAVKCDVYGGLYQWNEMMQYVTTPGVMGICPPTGGWHLPTDEEWCTLEQYIDPAINCSLTGWRGVDGGGKLKEAGTTHWASPNTGATNSSGFTALPGGRHGTDGNFYNETYYAYFWSSSESGSNAWGRSLYYNFATINRSYFSKDYGYSVRCLKDSNQAPSQPSNPNPPDNSTNQPLNTQLSWTCTDPENDPLTFDVYFGTTNPPAQVAAGQTDTTFIPMTLAYDTSYYWKITAHDDHGHSTEGPVWSFTTQAWQCGDPFVDERDNQEYTTVQIGTQCWMAENLNIGTMISGTSNQTNNALIEKYCYLNGAAICDMLGGLYQWDEMMQYMTTPGVKGICPDGWHLPTDAEWCTLTQFIDPTVNCGATGVSGTDVGTKMKSTTGWYGGGNGTNASGFTALPGGFRATDGSFEYFNYHANFWSSSESGTLAWYRGLHYSNANIYRIDYNKNYGFSVRCEKYPFNQSPAEPSNPTPPDNSTNQPLNTQLSWSCTDPDNDPLTFDVYFGTTNPPVQVAAGQTDTTFIPMTLAYDTSYYWKITAHDDHGHSTEGPVWSFTTQAWQCGDPFVDERDNQEYTTMQIGTQCWMAENLNIGTMIQGTSNQINNGTIEKYCYDNSTANCDVYGGLYQWNEMMQYVTTPGVKGICPDGWHVPTDAEYCTLTQFIDPTVNCGVTGWNGTDVGTKMKSTTGWYEGGNGTNASGFTALPGGARDYSSGSFYFLTYDGNFWCSSESGSNAWLRRLCYLDAQVSRYSLNWSYGFSVRCVRD